VLTGDREAAYIAWLAVRREQTICCTAQYASAGVTLLPWGGATRTAGVDVLPVLIRRTIPSSHQRKLISSPSGFHSDHCCPQQ